jgi:sporulation protein YlmC with PRC-barrel domain
MLAFALTELLGTPVFDTAGSRCGRVREVALVPQEDRARVAVLIIKTSAGDRLLPFVSVTSIDRGIRTDVPLTDWAKGDGSINRSSMCSDEKSSGSTTWIFFRSPPPIVRF